jgi:hypothetical protein
MKTPQPKRKRLTVEEALKLARENPANAAKFKALEEWSRPHVEEFLRAAAPLLEELRQAGYSVRQSPQELKWQYQRTKVRYPSAIPILVKWLPLISNPRVKTSILHALTVPWATEAAPALISEFRRALGAPPSDSIWKSAIGFALASMADDTVFDDLVDLARDKRHGEDRAPLVLALGNMKDGRAVDVLIELLQDGQVDDSAIMALGKLKAKRAEPYIERFLSDPRTWVRREAMKSLGKIRKAAG